MSDFKHIGNFKLDDDGIFQPFDTSEYNESETAAFQMPRDCGSFIVSFEPNGTVVIDEVSE